MYKEITIWYPEANNLKAIFNAARIQCEEVVNKCSGFEEMLDSIIVAEKKTVLLKEKSESCCHKPVWKGDNYGGEEMCTICGETLEFVDPRR